MARASDIVVGIGNPLFGDDGVGVEVVRRLSEMKLPEHVETYDGGTSGLYLACVVENRRRLVVVDAIDAGEAPGAVFRMSPNDIKPLVGDGLSVHDFHLLHALDETRLTGTEPEITTVIAIQVGDAAAGIGLTEPVQAAVDRVVAMVMQELDIPMEEVHCPSICAG